MQSNQFTIGKLLKGISEQTTVQVFFKDILIFKEQSTVEPP